MASLFWTAAHGVQGPQPRGEGELQAAAMGALGSSLPQAGRAGRRAWYTGWKWGWLEGPVLPGQRDLCPTPIQPGQPGCQVRVAWPGALQASLSPLLYPWPVSSLGVLA